MPLGVFALGARFGLGRPADGGLSAGVGGMIMSWVGTNFLFVYL